MSDTMTFPATVEEFMEQYKIVDDEKVYTNGADLVPIFRMMQWFEHVSATDINVGTNEDCISRQAAVDYCKKMLIETALNNVGFICNADELLLDIEENRIETWLSHVPPAQPEQRTGKWVMNDHIGTFKIFTCSECGWNSEAPFNFCPNCGSYNGGKDEI